MAFKRSAAALEEHVYTRSRRDAPKRTKLSGSPDERSNSSFPSSCSVSEDSALQSSPPASVRDRLSSMSSLDSAGSDDDSGSSVSSSSDSDLSESDEDQDIVTLGGPKKPDMSKPSIAGGQYDLKARLEALLPQLQQANSMLASESGQHSIEDVEDGEQHIEMDLGLGVLEEQRDDGDSGSESSIEASESEDGSEATTDQPASSGVVKMSPKSKETSYMDTLTGRRAEQSRSGIEEIG